MTTPPLDPDKRPGFPNPLMIFVIVGIIVVAIAAFLLLRPNPSGHTAPASPAAQQQ